MKRCGTRRLSRKMRSEGTAFFLLLVQSLWFPIGSCHLALLEAFRAVPEGGRAAITFWARATFALVTSGYLPAWISSAVSLMARVTALSCGAFWFIVSTPGRAATSTFHAPSTFLRNRDSLEGFFCPSFGLAVMAAVSPVMLT